MRFAVTLFPWTMKKFSFGAWLAVCLGLFANVASAASEWKAFSTAGGQAPAALALVDLAGKSIDLSALKGEVVLVNFWATWCEPCRDEMPSLNRLQQQLASKRFRVLGINVGEGKPRIEQFLTRVPVGFTVLRDADSTVTKAWRVRILPASFLVDKHGMLRYQLVGDADWDDPKIRLPIEELLK
ncbi:MAG: thiol-disulfide isomerase-like protein [Herminiimonas sp.]|nr:thiol-disulfide isomerase-like protein [Herminiimonas sp.]